MAFAFSRRISASWGIILNMKPSSLLGRTLLSLVVALFGASLFASDTILLHGHIYTENPKAPWAEALAITSGRIDAVGSDAEISRYRQSQTKVVDLQGRTVIPGIVDIHEHVMYGGMALHGFNLSTPEFNITPNDEDAFVDTIKVYAASHPDEKVLFGRASFPTTPDSAAKLELLDRAVPDRPLVIHATSEHALWVNSKTLALAGIGNKPVADATLEDSSCAIRMGTRTECFASPPCS